MIKNNDIHQADPFVDPRWQSASSSKNDNPPYNPPSYDAATGGSRKSAAAPPPPQPQQYAMPVAGPYYYQQHMTGHLLATSLPPDHPEMICLQQGGHISSTRFGILGILAGIFWFPLGIGLCLLDRRVVCRRCGTVMNGGISC